MDPSITPVLVVLLGGLALIVLGAALLAVVRAVSAPRELRDHDSEARVLVVLGRVLVITGSAAAILVFSCGFWPLAVVGLPVLGMAILRHRRARQYMLLSTLAVAADRLMPLAPAVEAFADERWGLMGYRARRLAALLESGLSLPDALHHTPGLVSREAQVTIRVGQESGVLAAALRDIVRSHEMHSPLWNQILGRVLYLCGVTLFASFVATFMIVKIAPEFRKIFVDFDCEMPFVTQLVFNASHFFAHFWFILVPPLLIIVLLFVLIGIQYVIGVRWSMPLVNRLTRRLDTAVILEALALAAEKNVAFQAEIETLARWYPRRPIRKRLEAVLGDVKAGAVWSQSLARRGLIKQVELAVFEAAGRAGNLPWALREMADSSRRRLNYRLNSLVQLLFPLAILALGLLVMIYVVGYFVPLISLIQNLTLT